MTINGDTSVEPDETFFVNLLDATNGGTIVKSQGIGTISNDDAAAGSATSRSAMSRSQRATPGPRRPPSP